MENIKLQPGDYTTREEIKAYAEREGIELMEAYQRICDAFVSAGAGEGEGVAYWDTTLDVYGWRGRLGVYHYSSPNDFFTRHLTPDQILTAGKQEDLQSEKQGAIPKKGGESGHAACSPQIIDIRTSSLDQPSDLQATIHDYIYLLNKTYDQKARELIESQLVDLMNLEYQRFNGESDND